jgi:hypothetical protein
MIAVSLSELHVTEVTVAACTKFSHLAQKILATFSGEFMGMNDKVVALGEDVRRTPIFRPG